MELVLIRGLPGSGKSTFAKSMIIGRQEHWAWFEADRWMINENAEYEFDPSKLSMVHKKCLEHTMEALNANINVVVSNTFSRRWEMQPYYDLGFPTTEIMMLGNYQNIHGVPDHKIQEMRDRWEF